MKHFILITILLFMFSGCDDDCGCDIPPLPPEDPECACELVISVKSTYTDFEWEEVSRDPIEAEACDDEIVSETSEIDWKENEIITRTEIDCEVLND